MLVLVLVLVVAAVHASTAVVVTTSIRTSVLLATLRAVVAAVATVSAAGWQNARRSRCSTGSWELVAVGRRASSASAIALSGTLELIISAESGFVHSATRARSSMIRPRGAAGLLAGAGV